MTEITDDDMRQMMMTTRPYTLVLLQAGPNYDSAGRDEIIWEHGRRNFSLRADGVLNVVCPVLDDSTWCGVGIFDAEPDHVIEIMDADPGVQAGVFTYEVHPVRSFPGDSLAS